MRTVLIVTGAIAALGAAVVLTVGIADARSKAHAETSAQSAVASASASAKTPALPPPKETLDAMKLTGFCEGAWCWEDPIPTGEDLGAVSARTNDVWIATSSYARPSSMIHWDGTNFTATKTAKHVTALARIGTTVWAATREGALLRSNGAAFEEAFTDDTSELRAIWSANENEAWAVGAGGTILHYDGAWHATRSPTTEQLEAVKGTGPKDVWAVGNRVILHWDGRAWSVSHKVSEGPQKQVVKNPGFCGNPQLAADHFNARLVRLDGILPFGPADVWVIARGARSLHWDGHTWKESEPGAYSLEATWAASSTDAWSIGRKIGHFDGKDWRFDPLPSNEDLVAVDGAAANDVWAVGGLGRIRRWDGTKWNALERYSGIEPRSLWAGDGVAWIGGAGGVARREAKGWRRAESPFGHDVNAIGGTRASDVWAFGAFENPAHFDGKEWSSSSVAGKPAIFGLAAPATDDVWGWSGLTYVHWDGQQWTPTVNGDFAIEDLWAPSKGTAFAIARPRADKPISQMSPYAYDKHVLAQWNGKTWVSLGETPAVAISGASGEPWVLGTTLQRRDHGKWIDVATIGEDSATPGRFVIVSRKLVVSGANDAWLYGGSKLQHWDGVALRDEDVPLDTAGVFVGPHDVFVYGRRGGVMHRAR